MGEKESCPLQTLRELLRETELCEGLCLGFRTQAQREGTNQEPQKWAFSGWEVSHPPSLGAEGWTCFKSLLSPFHPTHIQGWNADLRAAGASQAQPSPPSQDCDYLITAGVKVEKPDPHSGEELRWKARTCLPRLSFWATALLSRSSCSVRLPFAIILTTVSMWL